MTRDDIDRIVEELRQTLLMKIGEGEANTPAKLAFKKAETEFEYGRIPRAECYEWMYKEGVRDTIKELRDCPEFVDHYSDGTIKEWKWDDTGLMLFDRAEEKGTA